MMINKLNNWKRHEIIGLVLIYLTLICSFIVLNDSFAALISAFFGITYTFLAGKGTPFCYLFGITGSGFYGYLSFHNALWGNLILYLGYYIPMQILGFFKWNQHLTKDKNEIIKTALSRKEKTIILIVTFVISCISICILYILNDKNPVIDGITTIFSITGMYLTVKRAIEQWQIWIIVNGLSAIMWGKIAFSGERVVSTVIMWVVYFILAIYFYFDWRAKSNSKHIDS